jgi:hypothetical protein
MGGVSLWVGGACILTVLYLQYNVLASTGLVSSSLRVSTNFQSCGSLVDSSVASPRFVARGAWDGDIDHLLVVQSEVS